MFRKKAQPKQDPRWSMEYSLTMAPTEPQDFPPQGGSGIFPLGKSGYVSPQDKRIIPGGYGSDIPPLARNDATLRLMKQIEEEYHLNLAGYGSRGTWRMAPE